MKSPATVVRQLREQRQFAALKLAGTALEPAVCDVLDELIRRAQVIAEEYPESAATSLRDLTEMPAVIKATDALMNTARALSAVLHECANALQERRDPVLRFIERLKTEGYEVGNDFTVTDIRDWTILGTANPAIQVQIEADKIARAERTAAYQERIIRMATAFEESQDEYLRRVRNLINTVLDET